MLDRIVTEKIKAEVLGNGMDLVGFAPVDRWETAPFLLSPEAILPESKTVVVTGIHITDTWTEMGGEPDPQATSPGGWMDQNSFLDRIAYKVVRLLNEYGYKAIAVASSNIWRYREFADVKSLFAPDLSHIHAATAAGLAQIGWSGLAITPEFGPRVRFISIVTDADLEPTPMYDGPDLCDLCMDCVKACPSAAMRKDFNDKPHEITIGGKKFRYANKNIWRCAWAEHFSLDLDSKTLEQPHIGEEDILREINNKGIRGHERGVCQKVCIPPHLRSDAPSFGREDKKIAQMRINKKYPDNMPTFKKMTDDIISAAVKMGMDIVSVETLDDTSPAGKRVISEVPGVKTVIGFASQIPGEAKSRNEYNTYVSGAYYYGLRWKMHHNLLRLARLIEDFGYHAASYTGEPPPNKTVALELAAMAGVGSLADVFTTAEYGEDVIVGAITTDAPLEVTKCGGGVLNAKIGRPDAVTLKRKLHSLAEDQLVSLFGVAKADVFDTVVEDLITNIDETRLGETVIDEQSSKNHWAMHGKWNSRIIDEKVKIMGPKDYLTGAKSVIVLGMNIPHEIIKNSGLKETLQIGTYAYYTYQTAYELRFAAMELAKYLNRLGYKTLVTENMLGIGSKVDTPRELLPDARCGAIEAVAAGLGEIGRSGSLLTQAYGAHQRQIVIITDADLPEDKLYNGGRICNNCGNCESKCPMNAFEQNSFKIRIGEKIIEYPVFGRHRCDWSKRYSLNKDEGPELIGNKTNVIPPHDGELTIQEIAEGCVFKDEVMKKRTVILEPCLRHCSAGR